MLHAKKRRKVECLKKGVVGLKVRECEEILKGFVLH